MNLKKRENIIQYDKILHDTIFAQSGHVETVALLTRNYSGF